MTYTRTVTAAPGVIPTPDALRNRSYRSLPPDEYLTPAIRKAKAEADRIAAELRTTVARLAYVHSEEATEAAIKTDRDAAVKSIRSGQPASAAATPTFDALHAERDSLPAQIDALSVALQHTESAITEAFAELRDKPKQNGTETLARCTERYRAAAAELRAARREWAMARAVVDCLATSRNGARWNPSEGNRPVDPQDILPGARNVQPASFDVLLLGLTAEVQR